MTIYQSIDHTSAYLIDLISVKILFWFLMLRSCLFKKGDNLEASGQSVALDYFWVILIPKDLSCNGEVPCLIPGTSGTATDFECSCVTLICKSVTQRFITRFGDSKWSWDFYLFPKTRDDDHRVSKYYSMVNSATILNLLSVWYAFE